MKKMLRKTVAMFFALVLMCTLALTASAAGTYVGYVGIDDDDAQGYRNDSYGNWTRIYSSNLKYGEALITPCTTYGSNGAPKFYQWIFKSAIRGRDSMGINLSVWLHHVKLTDPAARYYVYTHSYVNQLIGTVNQNTAPVGYTDFPYVSIPAIDATGVNMCQAITLYPSTRGSNYNCGADWVEATIYD